MVEFVQDNTDTSPPRRLIDFCACTCAKDTATHGVEGLYLRDLRRQIAMGDEGSRTAGIGKLRPLGQDVNAPSRQERMARRRPIGKRCDRYHLGLGRSCWLRDDNQNPTTTVVIVRMRNARPCAAPCASKRGQTTSKATKPGGRTKQY